MFVNNETGVLQPIEDISKICKKYEALFFSDMRQALGKMDVRQAVAYVDFASFASHKIGGPKGIGALIVKDINNLNSFIKGGGQEFGKRSGTENLMNIQGFAKSIEDRLFEINSGKWDEI